MFTLETRKEQGHVSVMLMFTNDTISLMFAPKNPGAIKKVEWTDEYFSTGPFNEEFCIDWEGDDMIEMRCRKSDRDGGNLVIRVKATPELTASLKQAFDQWKALF